jgi:hypothetical protein
MNLYEQRAFKKTHLEAKKRVKETETDHVILFVPNRISSQRFQIFKAESFFKKNLKYGNIMCYLSHP